jgi:hypothetical protein
MASAGLTKLEAVNEMLAAIKEFPVAALDPGGTSTAALAESVLDRENKRVQSRGWHENSEYDVDLEPPDLEIAVTGTTGTFIAGETVTESTSGATGRFHQIDDDDKMELTVLTGTFTGGKTLTGATSTATRTGGAGTTALTEGEIVLDADVLRVDGTSDDVVMRSGKLYDRDENTATFDDTVNVTLVRLLDFDDLSPETKDLVAVQAKKKFQREMIGSPQADSFIREEEHGVRGQARRADADNADVNILTGTFAQRIRGQGSPGLAER